MAWATFSRPSVLVVKKTLGSAVLSWFFCARCLGEEEEAGEREGGLVDRGVGGLLGWRLLNEPNVGVGGVGRPIFGYFIVLFLEGVLADDRGEAVQRAGGSRCGLVGEGLIDFSCSGIWFCSGGGVLFTVVVDAVRENADLGVGIDRVVDRRGARVVNGVSNLLLIQSIGRAIAICCGDSAVVFCGGVVACVHLDSVVLAGTCVFCAVPFYERAGGIRRCIMAV